MKTISYWGKTNPIKARIIIMLSHLTLLFSSIYLGMTSYINDIRLPYEIIPLLVSIFFLAYIFYPKKGHQAGWWKHSYTRQKTMDGLLIISSFLVLILGINRFAYEPLPSNIAQTQLIVYKVNPNQSVTKSSIWKTVKSVKKKLKNDLKELKRAAKQKEKGRFSWSVFLMQFLLVLLVLALAIIATYAILALACHLSCSGYEALAFVTLIGGFIGIVWLTIIGFINIFKMSK